MNRGFGHKFEGWRIVAGCGFPGRTRFIRFFVGLVCKSLILFMIQRR